MKVLHVIPSLDPAAGGPPRVALRLAASVAQLGHSVSVLAYDSPHAAAGIAQERTEVPGASQVRQILLPPRGRLEKILGRQARRKLDSIIGEFDILQLHGVWDAINQQAALSARKQGVPYSILVHGMLDPWSLQQKKLKKNLAMAMGVRKTLSQAGYLHALNLDEKNGIDVLKLAAPVQIIPNGIYAEEFEPLPAKGEFYAAHPALKGRPYIAFLSRLHFKKGLDFLASSFAAIASRHPDLQLVVAGPDDGARAPFEADIAAAGLAQRVHVLGSVYGRERFHLLRDAAVFCLPSRSEGFSIAILEAMACATPVVISTQCHFPEVADAGAGLITELSVPAISAALDQIVSDPQLAEKMGQAGRSLVFRDFTWPQIARKTVAAYSEAIARAGNAAK